MKTIYILFVVFIDQQGHETMQRVNDAKYDSVIACHADKSHYKENDNIKFFCGDESKYFNKQQKIY